MTNQGIHRVSPNSKSGRQFYRVAKELTGTITPEVAEWNRKVEEKKRFKKEKKCLKS